MMFSDIVSRGSNYNFFKSFFFAIAVRSTNLIDGESSRIFMASVAAVTATMFSSDHRAGVDGNIEPKMESAG